MRLASYVLSFCLHLAAFLLIWFWPSHPPVRLDTPPVTVSYTHLTLPTTPYV